MYRHTLLTLCTRHAARNSIRPSASIRTLSSLKRPTGYAAHIRRQQARRLVHASSTGREPPSSAAIATAPGAPVDTSYSEPAQTEPADVRRGGPVSEYERLVQAGQFIDDSFQRTIVAKLDRLYQELLSYEPAPRSAETPRGSAKGMGSLWKQLLGRSKQESTADPDNVPRGLYIYGDVGTGKTTTMDLFYDTIPTQNKRRIHFHAFMLDVHARINTFRRTHAATADHIPTIARELANDAHVLCFDEFQVTDIADAMVLRRLVTELFRNGVVIVTTSNRHPDELYRNGIQRESFLPCIDLLKRHCEVVSLDSGTDYRKIARETESVYFSPITADTNKVLHALFALASGGAPVETDVAVRFLGRELHVPLAAGGVARFSFAQLCKEAHSAADYIELTKHYHTVVLTDVPVMHMSDRNEARRFITLIDALYESHAVLFMSSEADIYNLFTGRDEIDSHHREQQQQGRDTPETQGVMAYAGEEEVFAFQRAISRLVEMSSRRWIITGRNAALAENATQQELHGAGSHYDDPEPEHHGSGGGQMRSSA
ncbi:ATPase [Coemansia erecta]|uniref:ATPase n=1 Tax=Coemansia erecta TaxID=147472 RepID=A0A9W7Y5V2_9FUNG|nr:ATPase [Coemansia erecta]